MTDLFIQVHQAMSEPHRKYHTFNHISEMFMLANERNIQLFQVQVHAIALHDIVYKTPADPNVSNEMASSITAKMLLSELGYSNEHIAEVCSIILDTEKELPTIESSAVIIDLDLAGLAFDYWTNRVLIRAEFAHLSDKEFTEGRCKWLKFMLQRDKIFVSGLFDDLEEKAVYNMKLDIEQMENE